MCKFTPLGFETWEVERGADLELLCKFTPLGFETGFDLVCYGAKRVCVNLPRWGLKREKGVKINGRSKCKFTPLGFETNGAGNGKSK